MVLTRNSFKAHDQLCPSVIAGKSCASLHIPVVSSSKKVIHQNINCEETQTGALHLVNLLIEHSDLVSLVSVGRPHTLGANLIKLKHVGELVPRPEVAALVEICNA